MTSVIPGATLVKHVIREQKKKKPREMVLSSRIVAVRVDRV